MSRDKWGVSSVWRSKEVCLVRMGDRKKIYMMSQFSYLWDLEKQRGGGDVWNSSFGVANHKGGQFLWEGSSNYIILTFWKLLSLTGYSKSLYRIRFFTILAVLPVLYLLIYGKLKASINVCIIYLKSFYNTVSSFSDSISKFVWYEHR